MYYLHPHLPDFLARHPRNLAGERIALGEYEAALRVYNAAVQARFQEQGRISEPPADGWAPPGMTST